MANASAQAFSLAFELSPILLTGGVAANLTGGALPIISLIQAANFSEGLLAGGGSVTTDNAFATFVVLPGSSIINQQIGMYPFANQATAANAVITQPLSISFKMLCPAREPGDYGGNNLSIMSALQATLAQHNILGGLYTCLTPTFAFVDCVMTGMRDISGGETKQVQYAWQLDFIKPLVTQADAQTAQNNLMSKISGGSQINGQPSWSGSSNNPGSVQAPASIPAATPLPTANIASNAGLNVGQP